MAPRHVDTYSVLFIIVSVSVALGAAGTLLATRLVRPRPVRHILSAAALGIISVAVMVVGFVLGGGGKHSVAVALLSPGYFTITILKIDIGFGFEDFQSAFVILGLDAFYYALLFYFVLLTKERLASHRPMPT